MKLKFFARAEHVVHFPGPKQAGQVHNYVGRQFVLNEDELNAKKTRIHGQNRALREGFEIDSTADEAETLCHYVRQGGLWPADAETAQYCGVPFAAVEFDASIFEFVPAKSAAASATASSVKAAAQAAPAASKTTAANPE